MFYLRHISIYVLVQMSASALIKYYSKRRIPIGFPKTRWELNCHPQNDGRFIRKVLLEPTRMMNLECPKGLGSTFGHIQMPPGG